MVAVALPRPVSLREKLLTVGLVLGGRGVLGLGLGRSAVSAAAGNGLLNSLVAYWSLNEAGGANDALDLHSNGLTLTQVGSPGADTGKVYSTARTFDGTGDYFSRTSEALIQIGSASVCFAGWLWWTGVNNKGVLAKTNGANNNEYEVLVYSASAPYYLRFNFRNAANSANVLVIASEVLPTNTWFMFCAWYDHAAGTANIQINNGTIYTTNCGSVGIWSYTKNLRLGHYWTGNEFWKGRIGPVAMWKSAAGGGGALTSDQRAALFNGGAGLAYANFTT